MAETQNGVLFGGHETRKRKWDCLLMMRGCLFQWMFVLGSRHAQESKKKRCASANEKRRFTYVVD